MLVYVHAAGSYIYACTVLQLFPMQAMDMPLPRYALYMHNCVTLSAPYIAYILQRAAKPAITATCWRTSWSPWSCDLVSTWLNVIAKNYTIAATVSLKSSTFSCRRDGRGSDRQEGYAQLGSTFKVAVSSWHICSSCSRSNRKASTCS